MSRTLSAVLTAPQRECLAYICCRALLGSPASKRDMCRALDRTRVECLLTELNRKGYIQRPARGDVRARIVPIRDIDGECWWEIVLEPAQEAAQ